MREEGWGACTQVAGPSPGAQLEIGSVGVDSGLPYEFYEKGGR